MRKFKNLNVIRETDNEVIIEKLLDDGFEEVKVEEVEEVEETKGTNKGKGE
jgi:hypothetical protein